MGSDRLESTASAENLVGGSATNDPVGASGSNAEISECITTDLCTLDSVMHNAFKLKWRSRREGRRSKFTDQLCSWKSAWRKKRVDREEQARQMYLDQCANLGCQQPAMVPTETDLALLADAPSFEEVDATSDEEEEYTPEAILNERKVGRTTQYLTKWLGFQKSESTWEPRKNIASCFKVLHERWLAKSRGKDAKRKRTDASPTVHQRANGKRVCRPPQRPDS